jgi:hypothetical protein
MNIYLVLFPLFYSFEKLDSSISVAGGIKIEVDIQAVHQICSDLLRVL